MAGSAPTRRELLSGALSLAGIGAIPAAAGNAELKFGLTPVFLTSDIELLRRLGSYLERATARPVRLVTRRTYQEITALLLSDQIDAAWICGYPFVNFRPQLDLVAVPLWRAEPLYRSYLIVDRESPAAGLRDLAGGTHAFSDPDSNSGWLITASALARLHTTPARFFERTIFTYGHRNVIRAVASGLAASGSVDGYVYEVMRETEPELVGRTRILEWSELLGFPPIACSASAAREERIRKLQSALVNMRHDDDGRAVLAMLRLDGFSVESPTLYDPIAAKLALLREADG